jgi:hypothetical protein
LSTRHVSIKRANQVYASFALEWRNSRHASILGYSSAIIVAALATTSCEKSKPLPVPVPESAAPAMVHAFGAPPTEAEIKQFALDLEKAVRNNQAAKTESLLRTRDLFQRCVSDFGLTEKQMQDFMRGAERALQQTSLSAQIGAEVARGGSFKLLRVHTVDGRTRALFRILPNGGGVNYHDFLVARYDDGAIAMEDDYVYGVGELITQTMRRVLVPLISQVNAAKGPNAADMESAKAMSEMGKAFQAQNFALVSSKYKQLPKNMQENKSIMLLYIQALAADEKAEGEYVKAMERFRQMYPNDACIDFLSIDYYTLKKDFPAALKAVESIEKKAGGDPYLVAMRAMLATEKGDNAQAKKLFAEALKAEPDLELAHWGRISLALKEKNHADTLEGLKQIVRVCNLEIQNLAENADYADFVKSKEHRDWLTWYSTQKKKGPKG